MVDREKVLSDKLVEKSIEAFIMGLEIYNKPTIRYRIEGFSFFICNAWELMLKAKLLNDGKPIYFKDKPERTISLAETISKVYTDKSTRTRLNLEKIIDLRNTSTHFITEDYEVKYAPLFQSCVLNYTTELMRFHEIDITERVPQNFLTVTTVSYTHLDVYKRQIFVPEWVFSKRIHRLFILCGTDSFNKILGEL